MTILRSDAAGLADWSHDSLFVVLGVLLIVVAVWVAPVPAHPRREETPS